MQQEWKLTSPSFVVPTSAGRAILEEDQYSEICRETASKEPTGLTNPANLPVQTSFTKEISRTSNARWWIFVRVRYKDGTIRDSALIQLPS